MTRLRQVALCDAAVAPRPWSVEAEDAAVTAWRKVKSLTPEVARQEPRAIAEMIEHLIELKGGRDG